MICILSFQLIFKTCKEIDNEITCFEMKKITLKAFKGQMETINKKRQSCCQHDQVYRTKIIIQIKIIITGIGTCGSYEGFFAAEESNPSQTQRVDTISKTCFV